MATRITLAASLMSLGDPSGSNTLLGICNDPGTHPAIRIVSAIRLVEAGNESCNKSVIDLLANNPDTDTTTMGLEYLERGKHIPAEELDQLKSRAAINIHDKDPGNRWNSARILSQIGDSSSLNALKQAIASESDPETKNRMQSLLQHLEIRLRIGTP